MRSTRQMIRHERVFMLSPRRALCAATLSAALLILVPTGVANAASLDANLATAQSQTLVAAKKQAASISPIQYKEAFKEFEASAVPREYSVVDGTKFATFKLTKDFSLTMVAPETDLVAPGNNVVAPMLSAGGTKYGFYFGFNQFDQNVLSNAFLAAGLTAAICAIPGVGWVACVVAGIAVSVGTSYVHKNGVCSGGRTLYWWDVRGGSTIGCLSSVPRPV